jgi:hypothetical protein
MRRSLVGFAAIAAVASMPMTAAHAADTDIIRAACAAIGLTPSETPFTYCVRSLEDAVSQPALTLRPTIRADAAVGSGETRIGHRSEYACRAVGIDPGTARYSYCVTNLKQTLFDDQNALTR